jgi:hypothetical protein
MEMLSQSHLQVPECTAELIRAAKEMNKWKKRRQVTENNKSKQCRRRTKRKDGDD